MKLHDSASKVPDSELRKRLVQHLAGGQLSLPLLPDTAAQVIEVCGDAGCDARQLAELIQRDMSLASHVLRISNSAAYAPNEPIVSLQQAVSRLGFSAICGIAIGVAVQGKMFQVQGHEETLKAVWRHCAAAGAWAKEIARLRRRNVEGAFLCGLLHDVGRPIVLQSLVELTRGLAEAPPAEELDALMDEFHERVGGQLLAKWGMPEWIVESVSHHHHFAEAPNFTEEAATACLAEALAHWSLDTDRSEDELVRGLPAVTALGLYADELDPLFERTDSVNELAEAFL